MGLNKICKNVHISILSRLKRNSEEGDQILLIKNWRVWFVIWIPSSVTKWSTVIYWGRVYRSPYIPGCVTHLPEESNYQDFWITPIFAELYHIFLRYLNKIVDVLEIVTSNLYICPQVLNLTTNKKTLIYWHEIVCQQCGCVQGEGAGLAWGFIAHAVPFGN